MNVTISTDFMHNRWVKLCNFVVSLLENSLAFRRIKIHTEIPFMNGIKAYPSHISHCLLLRDTNFMFENNMAARNGSEMVCFVHEMESLEPQRDSVDAAVDKASNDFIQIQIQ